MLVSRKFALCTPKGQCQFHKSFAVLTNNRRAANVKARSSSVTPSKAVWDESMTLIDLKTELDAALKVEDYALAARLRDLIQMKQVDSKLAVEEANLKFYEAFRSGNFQAMDEIWGQGDHIQVIHPGSNCIAGRESVMESWRLMMRNIRPRTFKIALDDVRIAASDTQGFVTCVEIFDADDMEGRICATNIFEKQNGKWVITHHHGGAAPARRKPRKDTSGSP